MNEVWGELLRICDETLSRLHPMEDQIWEALRLPVVTVSIPNNGLSVTDNGLSVKWLSLSDIVVCYDYQTGWWISIEHAKQG
jgi:hypothetical protein